MSTTDTQLVKIVVEAMGIHSLENDGTVANSRLVPLGVKIAHRRNATEQKIRDGKMFWADYLCEFGTANECLDANRKLKPRATSNPVALRKIDASIKFWQDFIAQSSAEWKKPAK